MKLMAASSVEPQLWSVYIDAVVLSKKAFGGRTVAES
jgi:hypothetical protein